MHNTCTYRVTLEKKVAVQTFDPDIESTCNYLSSDLFTMVNDLILRPGHPFENSLKFLKIL